MAYNAAKSHEQIDMGFFRGSDIFVRIEGNIVSSHHVCDLVLELAMDPKRTSGNLLRFSEDIFNGLDWESRLKLDAIYRDSAHFAVRDIYHEEISRYKKNLDGILRELSIRFDDGVRIGWYAMEMEEFMEFVDYLALGSIEYAISDERNIQALKLFRAVSESENPIFDGVMEKYKKKASNFHLKLFGIHTKRIVKSLAAVE